MLRPNGVRLLTPLSIVRDLKSLENINFLLTLTPSLEIIVVYSAKQ